MSHDLKPITGRIEVPNSKTRTSEYYEDQLSMTSFAGGGNGRMLQLTLPQRHIQLTRLQVKELIEVLSEWADI